MKINYEGRDILVEIIGGFKIDEKEYAVCSYVDSDEVYKIVIVQVIRNGNDMQVINIPDEDMVNVLEKYNQIKEEVLEGDMDE